MARRKGQTRGLIRDDNGVVLALDKRHPMLDIFTAIPLSAPDVPGGGDLPPINLPTEMKQQLALHMFENLYPGLPSPFPPGVQAHLVDDQGRPIVNDRGEPVIIRSSKYRLVNPTGDDSLTMGGAGEHWLSWKISGEAVRRRAAEAMADVGQAVPMPDVTQMNDDELAAYSEQLRAQQLAIENRLVDSERARQMDIPIDTNTVAPPEFGNWRGRNRDKLRDKRTDEEASE